MALGTIRARDCLELIIDVAETDPDERVRYDAMVALGMMGDDRAVPHLTRWAAERVNEFGEAGAALGSLAQLGHRVSDG